jgi:hypothetical protein
MSLHGAPQLVLGFLPHKPIVLEASAARLSSDGGLLVIRQFDQQIALTERFAGALQDLRSESAIHSVSSMVRQRIYGILADYEDQNDHDDLRTDPVFKLIADRDPDGQDLASQPTLSRFENAVSIPDLWRLRDELLRQFLDGFDQPPPRITLDVDAFDDPTHGQQQLTFFHGHYDQHQYYPVAITCAENEQVALVGLRHGTAHAALGVDDDLRFLTAGIRQRWPDVQISVRGDSAFGIPLVMDVCEELGLTYTFGLGSNSLWQRESEDLMAQAVSQYAATGQKQRLFLTRSYQARSWPGLRQVIVKCEADASGTNRRLVVTNRPGAALLPGPTYDEYADRGESENRNKELKRGLLADRLSDHRFLANFFRLFLHAAALNLLVRLRRSTRPVISLRSLGLDDSLPAEALSEADRKRLSNRRRRRDPLGRGQPATWRSRLIKVAVEVIVSTRRVLVRLSSSWPHVEGLFRIGRLVGGSVGSG